MYSFNPKFCKSRDRVKKHRYLKRMRELDENCILNDVSEEDQASQLPRTVNVDREDEWVDLDEHGCEDEAVDSGRQNEASRAEFWSDDEYLHTSTSNGSINSHNNESRSDVCNPAQVPAENSEEVGSAEEMDPCISKSPECKPQSMKEKIHKWALDNLAGTRLKTITELLNILRSEGYDGIPRTASGLLGFKHKIQTRQLICHKGTIGDYVYLGIKNGLESRIIPEVYKETTIRVQVHIDGMKVFKNTKGSLWPIAMKVFHPNYVVTPFVVAAFYGRSKPQSVSQYLKDFVQEISSLIDEGVTIHGKKYQFELMAVIADSPARAFLKCIKGPTAYFGCERCTIEGKTFNHKRVYSKMNSSLRTKETFCDQTQCQHHLIDPATKEALVSPLVQIPRFDPIKNVPLEIMHLLYLNVMKNLGEKWISRKKNEYKLPRAQLQVFKASMELITPFVPKEFQRKQFDVDDYLNWKATQYSFLLMYVGGIVLKDVLDHDKYCHFLLLHVAARILCNNEWVVKYTAMATQFLQNFVKLMPTYYGLDIHTMVFHHLVHVGDDAEYFQMSLSYLSAFWGENYIGKLKNLVSSNVRPLAQIVNRIHALDSSEKVKIRECMAIRDAITSRVSDTTDWNGEKFVLLDSVTHKDKILCSKRPDNIVQLSNHDILIIKKLYVKQQCAANVRNTDDIYVEGYRVERTTNAFTTPCPSQDIGISKIIRLSSSSEFLSLENVKQKCMMINLKNRDYAISLLHE